MKLIWNEEEECFKNENNKGKRYWLTRREAERIIQSHGLGYTPAEIYEAEMFQSTKITASTIKNFINRFEKGDVVFDDKRQTLQEEVTELHNRVRLLEDWKDQFELNWLGKLLFRRK
nr:MAG TPA: Manganese responsive transcriptional regulator member, ferric uptake regulator, apo [Caudoviricetes sp.]